MRDNDNSPLFRVTISAGRDTPSEIATDGGTIQFHFDPEPTPHASLPVKMRFTQTGDFMHGVRLEEFPDSSKWPEYLRILHGSWLHGDGVDKGTFTRLEDFKYFGGDYFWNFDTPTTASTSRTAR